MPAAGATAGRSHTGTGAPVMPATHGHRRACDAAPSDWVPLSDRRDMCPRASDVLLMQQHEAVRALAARATDVRLTQLQLPV